MSVRGVVYDDDEKRTVYPIERSAATQTQWEWEQQKEQLVREQGREEPSS